MEKGFSSEVKQALNDIYYNVGTRKGAEGFALLEQASAAGDGDASCILARCLCGKQYVWPGHGFPVDDARVEQLLHKSVEQGSALGVLVCMRTGELTPALQRKMPFSSLQEAFDIVLEMAEAGDAFCQYTIGNTYFWWDFMEIQGKDRSSFSSDAKFKAYLKENISKCEDWFQKAFRGGIFFAGNNLDHYYTQGDEDIIAPHPQKAKELNKIGAEMGYPTYQHFYADELMDKGKVAEAIHWYQLGSENGQPECWLHLGELYEKGKGVPQDLATAAQYYEKGLTPINCDSHRLGCVENLGILYYHGQGVPQDFNKAFSLLNEVMLADYAGTAAKFCLGMCYFYGRGTQTDYRQARKLLESVLTAENIPEANYALGVMYCQSLGIQEDIAKGVEYLKNAKNYPAAKEELQKYKRTLFGKWVRR